MFIYNCFTVYICNICRVFVTILCIKNCYYIFTFDSNFYISAFIGIFIVWFFRMCNKEPLASIILTKLIKKIISKVTICKTECYCSVFSECS